MKIDLNKITTEQQNKASAKIDEVSTLELTQIINDEDVLVAKAIKKELANISKAIDAIVKVLQKDGRLVYMGAGTSGRLGILDASEMLPTFNVQNKVIGIIAGGEKAIKNSVEGAEDDVDQAIKDLQKIKFNQNDILVGISASGRTPYVVSALKYANSLKAKTISLATSLDSQISKIAKIKIEPVTGPEVITGSTRMKSGTCQKMVLNMLSTGAMIKLGKVYNNLMVDVLPKNEKLVERCHVIVEKITHADRSEISKSLKLSNNDVKIACVMILKKIDVNEAKKILKKNNNILKLTLK